MQEYNSNAKCTYYIKSPNGQEFKDVVDLSAFCDEHDMNYKWAAEQARNNKPYKGWTIVRIEKSEEEDKKLDSVGLTLEEKYGKILDDNTKLKTQLKEYQRESTLFKMLADTIKQSTTSLSVAPYVLKNKNAKITESAVLLLSDLHADQEIISERVNGLENYNFDVACKRAERIVDTTISHLVDNMKNYNFERLYIFGLGDYVNGTIHQSNEHSKWKNSIKNSIGTGELIAHMIRDLSAYFPQIVFASVSGNHGRFTQKKDYRGAMNNWDYLVNTQIVTRLDNLIKENKLITIIPDAWSLGINIYGYNFCLNHGDDIKSFNSIPFYGIERKVRRLTSIGAVTNQIPNYFCYAHFHNIATQAHTTGEVFLNGSFQATSEFAYESLGAYNEPVQLLFGVHERWGVSWRLPVRLRTPDWKKDEQKKSRYNIKIVGDCQ